MSEVLVYTTPSCPYCVMAKRLLSQKGVAFTELETPDVGHVWPYWRQNLAEMVPQLFEGNGK